MSRNATPIPFDPRAERPTPDEARIAAQLTSAMTGIQRTTLKDYGHALRSVHAKSHALLEGEMEVLKGVPKRLAQGLFAKPGRYPVILRLSTNPGDVLDDSISVPRGLAIKIMGVQGKRLPGSEGERTQDFILVNGPAFAAPDTATFAKNLSLLAATTDTGQAWKKAFSATLRGLESALELAGTQSPMLKTLGGQPITHPLGETFFSQTPFRFGEWVAKFQLAPVSKELKALKDKPVDVSGKPNGLRAAAIDFFQKQGGEWEFRVQLRTNPKTMPIEDASVVWPERESPYVPVARIRVKPQPAWSEERAEQVDDGLAFNVWTGLTDHQPIGSINRARKNAYATASRFRSVQNACPIHEPNRGFSLSRAPAQVFGSMPGREGRWAGTPDVKRQAPETPASWAWRDVSAGAMGGLAAGAILSALLAQPEIKNGKPSELIKLQRRTAGKLGLSHRKERAAPTLAEELFAHGGHLALAAIAGAGYGMMKGGGSPLTSGLAFGIAVYGLAYGLVGPMAGVSPWPWRDSRSSMAQHAMMHALFGIATGLLANRIARRI